MDYRIARYTFTVDAPRTVGIDALLPSFHPFRCMEAEGRKLFHFTLSGSRLPEVAETALWETAVNDMGYTRLLKTASGYRVELQTMSQGVTHRMDADSAFTTLTAFIHMEDPYRGEALSSLLRIAYSQAVLLHAGISVHASSVVVDGKAYLFMGKSGTGKSTHAALWTHGFPHCELLNDDILPSACKPAVHLIYMVHLGAARRLATVMRVIRCVASPCFVRLLTTVSPLAGTTKPLSPSCRAVL